MRAGTALIFAGFAVIVFAAPWAASAQDYRVETSVFYGNETEPRASNVTLFAGGVVYDFPLTTAKGSATIFDPGRGRFVLMNAQKKVYSELELDDLGAAIRDLQTHGLQSDFPFYYDPRFDEQFDAEKKEILLSSQQITYRCRGIEPPGGHQNAVLSYRQFADWFKRLNSIAAASPPPFARLKLNHALQLRGLLPSEIELTLKHGRSQAKYRSRQEFAWQLTPTDQRLIQAATGNLANFSRVPFAEYQRATRE